MIFNFINIDRHVPHARVYGSDRRSYIFVKKLLDCRIRKVSYDFQLFLT